MAPDEPGRDGDIKTGVYVMSQFASANNATWKDGMIKGLNAVKQQGAQKLILDLSNNGGGDICAAYALMKLLVPNGGVGPFLTDIRVTKALSNLITTGFDKKNTDTIFSPQAWFDTNGQKFQDLSWIQPLRTRTLDDGTQTPVGYSQFFEDSCDYTWGDFKLPFAREDIAFVTNGFCLSSCSLVFNQLYESAPEIETITTTAFTGGVGITPSTLTGGMVYSASDMSADIADIGTFNDPKLDMTLPVSGDVRFAFREAYSRKEPSKVLEFVRRNSKYRLEMDEHNTLRQDAVWQGVKHLKGWSGTATGDSLKPEPKKPNRPPTLRPRKIRQKQ